MIQDEFFITVSYRELRQGGKSRWKSGIYRESGLIREFNFEFGKNFEMQEKQNVENILSFKQNSEMMLEFAKQCWKKLGVEKILEKIPKKNL